MFKDLNRFERYFLIIGLIINLVIAVLSKSDLLAVICAVCSLFNAVYVAKGSIVSYIFGFIATITYIWIAFSQRYYSEMIVNLIVLGITLYGFRNWQKNRSGGSDQVVLTKLSRKEICLSILSQVILFPVYYMIFDHFDNGMILVSTINMCLSILSFYYNARISKISFIVLIIGGIFKSILWIAPMLKGDLSNTSVLVSCLLYLVCDAYGYLNWRKMEKIQDTLQNN